MTAPPKEVQRELLRAYHIDGDERARDRLIEENLPLVRAIARRYVGRGEQLDDLVQVGSIGLIKAIDRFDLDRGVDLQTYAIPTIVGEIKRHFRDRGWAVHVPRRLKELNLKLARLIEQLSGQLGRSPTMKELAEAAGTNEEEVVEALESGYAYSTDSLNTGGGGDDDSELDRMRALGEADEGYTIAEDRDLLTFGLKALDERERRIIHLRFFEGLTQSQIALEIGISQMHVSRLIRRALEKMREEIEEQ
jgi:RNA polymerase sigma-B factor